MNRPLIRTTRHALLSLLAACAVARCATATHSAHDAQLEITERGSVAIVTAALDTAGIWTRDAFADFSIRMQETARLHDGRMFKGNRGAREVTADLKPAGASATRVEITVRKDLAGWDTLYARKVLRKIMQRQR